MIGIDIVNIRRIKRIKEKFGIKFLEKFLNESEIELASKTETIAGLWAAKEAVSKALGSGIGNNLGFKDIKISKNEKGAPFFILPQKIVQRYKIISTSLSISHDGDYAIAIAQIDTDLISAK